MCTCSAMWQSPKSVPVSVLFSTWIEQFASWKIGNSVNWVYISLESKQTKDWPQLLGCSQSIRLMLLYISILLITVIQGNNQNQQCVIPFINTCWLLSKPVHSCLSPAYRFRNSNFLKHLFTVTGLNTGFIGEHINTYVLF